MINKKMLIVSLILGSLCSCQYPYYGPPISEGVIIEEDIGYERFRGREKWEERRRGRFTSSAVKAPNKVVHNKKQPLHQVGVASWYGPNFHGKKTANGSIYNQYEYTAAHPLLPMHSVVKVSNLENQKSVLVVINDRGPYVDKSFNRIIDLSHRAAYDLGIINKGLANVKVEYLFDHTQKLLAQFAQNKHIVNNIQVSKAMVKHITQLNAKNAAAT